MRTTLDIDLDVLEIAKSMAKARRQTIGKTLSGLVREALQRKKTVKLRNGVPVYESVKGEIPMGIEQINKLRDEL